MLKKILIVEDDPIAARVFSTHLQRAGFEVKVAVDGQSGLEQVLEFHPEGLLIDFMLPKMNGIELVKKVRAQQDMQSNPVVVYTNACVPNVVQEALAAGATHVFDKATVTPQQLVEVFRRAVTK